MAKDNIKGALGNHIFVPLGGCCPALNENKNIVKGHQDMGSAVYTVSYFILCVRSFSSPNSPFFLPFYRFVSLFFSCFYKSMSRLSILIFLKKPGR